MWNGDRGVHTWCPAIEPMCQIMFYNHVATFGTIYKSANIFASNRCNLGDIEANSHL